MISEYELEQLMRAAMSDCRKDPDFLRALPEAVLHTLAPASDDTGRLRLWMFRQPNGVLFIPYFTNLEQARESAAGQLRVVTLPGKQLLEISRGATVIINPNHESCRLHPEEIDALVSGNVAVIATQVLKEGCEILVTMPSGVPTWIIETLRDLYGRMPFVECAWLVDAHPVERPDDSTLVVCLDVAPPHQSRAATATLTALQAGLGRETFTVDVIVENGTPPAVEENGLLIYPAKVDMA